MILRSIEGIGVTHLSIKVIIYQGGSSLRHPKGARSIGIGHPQSGDRCTEPLPYHLDPLRVAEQPPPSRRPVKGRDTICTLIHRSSALRASTDAFGTGILADADITVRASCIWAKRPTCPTRGRHPDRGPPLDSPARELAPSAGWRPYECRNTV